MSHSHQTKNGTLIHTVSIVLDIALDVTIVDENLDVLSTLSLGLVPLVSCDNGKLIGINAGVGWPSTGLDVDAEGGALDGHSLQGHFNVVNTGFLRVVVDGVGAWVNGELVLRLV